MTQIDNGGRSANTTNRPNESPGFRGMEYSSDLTPTAEHDNNAFNAKLDVMGKGIVTGVIVSTITQTGRNIASRLLKNPVFLFGVGLATGYLAHKYRREIVCKMDTAVDQGRIFASRQRENLKARFLETAETGKK